MSKAHLITSTCTLQYNSPFLIHLVRKSLITQDHGNVLEYPKFRIWGKHYLFIKWLWLHLWKRNKKNARSIIWSENSLQVMLGKGSTWYLMCCNQVLNNSIFGHLNHYYIYRLTVLMHTYTYFNSPKPWRVLIPSFLFLLSSFSLLPIILFYSLLL